MTTCNEYFSDGCKDGDVELFYPYSPSLGCSDSEVNQAANIETAAGQVEPGQKD